MNAAKQFNMLNGATVSKEHLLNLLKVFQEAQREDLVERIQTVLDFMSKDGVETAQIIIDDLAKAIDTQLRNEILALEDITSDVPAISTGLNGALLADGHELMTLELAEFYGIDLDELQALNASAKDVEAIVQELILERIKSGDKLPPWRKTWAIQAEKAHNYITKHYYSGSNSIILNVILAPFMPTPYYMTAKQINEKGGKINKGTKGVPLVYYNFYYKLKDLSKHPADEAKLLAKIKGKELGRGKNKKVIDKTNYAHTSVTEWEIENFEIDKNEIYVQAFMRYFTVFNVGHTNLEYDPPKPVIRTDAERIEAAEAIIKSFTDKPKLEYDKDQPSYAPKTDTVFMPKIKEFETSEDYYSTYFHELVHSTAHKSRLDRSAKYKDKDKNSSYAFEELVAELGASYLCGLAGFLEFSSKSATAYLKNWHERLVEVAGDNPDFFVFATKEAQAAVDYIIRNYNPDEKPKPKATDKEKAAAKARALILKVKLKNKTKSYV